MRWTLGSLLLTTLAATAAEAGPWGQEAKRFYLKAEGSSLATTTYATPEGSEVEIPEFQMRALRAYLEYGLGAGLTSIVEAPIALRSQIEEFGSASGPGDLRLGLQWTRRSSGPGRVALRATLQVPTGDENKGEGLLPTGSGVFEAEFLLSAGTSLARGAGWLQAEAGPLLRGGGFRDSLRWSVQAGVWAGSRLSIAANLGGVETYDRGAIGTGSATGLGDGVAWTGAGSEASLRIGGALSLVGGFDHSFRGRNLALGTTFRFGLAWRG